MTEKDTAESGRLTALTWLHAHIPRMAVMAGYSLIAVIVTGELFSRYDVVYTAGLLAATFYTGVVRGSIRRIGRLEHAACENHKALNDVNEQLTKARTELQRARSGLN